MHYLYKFLIYGIDSLEGHPFKQHSNLKYFTSSSHFSETSNHQIMPTKNFTKILIWKNARNCNFAFALQTDWFQIPFFVCSKLPMKWENWQGVNYLVRLRWSRMTFVALLDQWNDLPNHPRNQYQNYAFYNHFLKDRWSTKKTNCNALNKNYF